MRPSMRWIFACLMIACADAPEAPRSSGSPGPPEPPRPAVDLPPGCEPASCAAVGLNYVQQCPDDEYKRVDEIDDCEQSRAEFEALGCGSEAEAYVRCASEAVHDCERVVGCELESDAVLACREAAVAKYCYWRSEDWAAAPDCPDPERPTVFTCNGGGDMPPDCRATERDFAYCCPSRKTKESCFVPVTDEDLRYDPYPPGTLESPVAGDGLGCLTLGRACTDDCADASGNFPDRVVCSGLPDGEGACVPFRKQLERCDSSANCIADYPICVPLLHDSGFCATRGEVACLCADATFAARSTACSDPDEGAECIAEGDRCLNRPENCCTGLECFMNRESTSGQCQRPCDSDADCEGDNPFCRVFEGVGKLCLDLPEPEPDPMMRPPDPREDIGDPDGVVCRTDAGDVACGVGDVCCGAVLGPGSCAEAMDCGGGIACDGPEDCPGELCCGTIVVGAGFSKVECAPSCQATDVTVICKHDRDCLRASATCGPSSTPNLSRCL